MAVKKKPIALEFFNNDEKIGKVLLWQLLLHILQVLHGVLDRLVLAALPFFRHRSFFGSRHTRL